MDYKNLSEMHISDWVYGKAKKKAFKKKKTRKQKKVQKGRGITIDDYDTTFKKNNNHEKE